MHLCKKWSKYAFAYASMQMHNYPKPTDEYVREKRPVCGNIRTPCLFMLNTSAKRFGNSFGIRYNFGKIYRENR